MACSSRQHGDTTASAQSPFRLAEALYQAASARFCGLPQRLEFDDPETFEREQDAFNAAVRVLDRAPVADWQEFAAQFDHACDGGNSVPSDGLLSKLLADAKRLAAEERR
jgi:hypothetical protein